VSARQPTPLAVVPSRKRTDPGGFRDGGFEGDDDTPTAPGGGLDPDALAMVRLFDGLNANEKHEAVKLLEGWAACTIDRRVLLRALAGELSKIHAAEV
jgi:hypothetical protein